MKKNRVWILLSAALLLLLVVASVLYARLSSGEQAQQLADETEGQQSETIPAPDFSVQDKNLDTVSLSDFFGKPIVLNFWASWCGPCKSEMPDFAEAFEKYGGEVHFLMVNLTDGSRETVDAAAQYIAQQGYEFPVYYDTAMEAAIAYGVSAVPTTYFIDQAGNIVARGSGALDAETLQKGISMIFSE